MAVTSTRTIQVGFSGDITSQVIQSALENATSPAEVSLIVLEAGNTAVVPSFIYSPTGLTIIPPSGNLNIITLKGANGDTGIPLHLTDPTSLSLSNTDGEEFEGLVLSVADQVVGVRLIWS